MWPLLENLNVLNTLTLKEIFWKMKAFFLKKTSEQFVVESSTIEKA